MQMTPSNILLDIAIEKCFNKQFLSSPLNEKKNRLYDMLIDVAPNYKHRFPWAALLKVSSQCNLRCKHCFYYMEQEQFNPDNDFSIEELLKLAKFLVEELNVINFIISGGEPFVQKDILKLLKYLKSKNVSIQLQTNGTLVTEDIAIELEKIFNPKSDTVQVSLEGAADKIHDSIRGNGSFNKTISGIKSLVKHNINVFISHTVTSNNVKELSNLYKLCKILKLREIRLNKFEVCSKEQAHLAPEQEQVFLSIADLIDTIGEDKSIELKLLLLKTFDFLNYKKGVDLLDNYLGSNISSAPNDMCIMCHKHNKVNICCDGKMYLCSYAEKDEFRLGNLRQNSFLEIWENRFSSPLFQERKLEDSICKKCKYVSLCRSGCPAKAYSKYGTINAPDSDCKYAEYISSENNEKDENYVK